MSNKEVSAEPLEWWEEVQLNLLGATGTDVTYLRENPAEWRRLRVLLRELMLSRNEGK